MGEAEAKKRRIFAALGILWATVAAATSTGETFFIRLTNQKNFRFKPKVIFSTLIFVHFFRVIF